MKGRVISAHGRHYQVELENGQLRQCYTRGKKTGICVGDFVRIQPQGEDEGSIEETLERQNLLYRSDEMRSKQFAANVDQLLIVVATEPVFSDDLTGRALTGAWSANISPIILLNKCDLESGLARAQESLGIYREMGVPIISCSIYEPEQLKRDLLPLLKDKTSLLLGQSGMGKSSILNVLIPDAKAHTQAHSVALGTGKHTTTSTRLYHLPGQTGCLIDSPGFQAFGLYHLAQTDIANGFPEFKEHIESCRFYNCTHLHEPGCGVLAALKDGKINSKRHELYERILLESQSAKRY
ncbi:ribosome small subunit-dependent GTPase A [Advenella alkanexedens]|uniref:Small ribosomal subunit biogenesis GTPase RsgA n=1 Tax=Advenella alkanexedens TaxID=1481665 RepID=A0ABS6NNE0_9BURK|nr:MULTISPECIES: ribosome small subunit-dependent GTPase A [Advenella]MBV4397145.1 ribosome small subunit-dependent GTPase A [Advenella alkanexedens]WKU18219.1 ribosome small subunit-dependent GTPase A [Advenella alkanexedens]